MSLCLPRPVVQRTGGLDNSIGFGSTYPMIVIYALNSIDYPLDESSSNGFLNRLW